MCTTEIPARTGRNWAGTHRNRQPWSHSASTLAQILKSSYSYVWVKSPSQSFELHIHSTQNYKYMPHGFCNNKQLSSPPLGTGGSLHFAGIWSLTWTCSWENKEHKSNFSFGNLPLHIQKFWIFVSNSSVRYISLCKLILEILKMFLLPTPHI